MQRQREKSKKSRFVYVFGDRGLDTDVILAPIAFQSEDAPSLIESWLQIQEKIEQCSNPPPEWNELEHAYLSYLKWRFQYVSKITKQQIVLFWVIVGIVFVLVISGVVFSFIQLEHSFSVGRTFPNTELSMREGIEFVFRSSAVGALILLSSLVFFYASLKSILSLRQVVLPHISILGTDAPQLFGLVPKNMVEQNRKDEG